MSGKSKEKIKQWLQRVKVDDLDGVNEDIKDSIIDYTVPEHSAAMNNLLSQICQTARQVSENEKTKALKVYHLSYTVCSKIKKIDCNKYSLCLYWITKTLLDAGLHDEAKSLCSFMSPSSFFHEQTPGPEKTYGMLSVLWQKAVNKFIQSLSRVEIEMNFNSIISYILFQLNYLKLSRASSSHWLFYYIRCYLTSIISKKTSQQLVEKAKQVLIMNTLSTFDLSLGDDKKSQVFESALFLVKTMLIPDIDDDQLAPRSTIEKVFKVFDKCLGDDADFGKDYKLLRDTYPIFIRPVDEITDQVAADIAGLTLRLKRANRQLEKMQADDKTGTQIISVYICTMMNAILNYWMRSKEEFAPTTLINTARFGIELCETLRLSRRDCCNCGAENCRVKNEDYNSIKISIRLITLGFNLYKKIIDKIPGEFIDIILLISSNAVNNIAELKSKDCKFWSALWNNYLSAVYNFSTLLVDNYYENACNFYCLLSASMIRLNALSQDFSCFLPEDGLPLAVVLHRLTSAHFVHEKYPEAMSAAAANIYLHHENGNCKGFRLWINIKYRHKEAEETSVIEYLRDNKPAIEQLIGSSIDLNRKKENEINLREIKTLSEAHVNCSTLIMKILDHMTGDKINYLKGVNYLGSHVLKFATHKSINKYIENALAFLRLDGNTCPDGNLLKSNLKFYEFIEDLEHVQNETDEEMKKLKTCYIPIYAVDVDKQIGKTDAGPTGSKIDIDTAIKFSKQLEKVMIYWHDCFKDGRINKIDETNGNLTLKNIITAAEFCRFHRYQDLEIKFWKLAHLLSTTYNDYRSIVYVTGRCLSARYVKETWIKQAQDLIITKFDVSKKIKEDINAIAVFKLSLSEYYYQSELFHAGEELFNEAMALPNMEFVKSLGVYLYSLDITLAHRLHNFKKDKTSHEKYLKIFIEGIYTGASIWNGDSQSNPHWSRSRLFYEIDCLLDFVCHASLRLTQLLTAREIQSNIIKRIQLVQKLANPLRTAELIKYLCFVDLLTERLNDCEVKIQSIEHILKIEDIDLIRKLKLSDTTCEKYSEVNYQSDYIIEPLRDLPRNDTSPVLRKKVFIMPEFSKHENNCKCFKCRNVFYKHLVLSSTHIRAQLHSLQNENLNSLEHFTGGFNVIAQLMDFSADNKNHQYHQVVEYVYYLMDYAKLLAKISKNSARSVRVVTEAREVCKKFHLECHPISLAVDIWLLENKLGDCVEDEGGKSSLCVLDIDQQVMTLVEDGEGAVCQTPKRVDSNMAPGRVINLKCKRNNPMLTLSKVNSVPISVGGDDDDDEKELKADRIKERPIRRKFSDSEFLDGEAKEGEKEKEPEVKEYKIFKTFNSKGSTGSLTAGGNLEEKQVSKKRENKFFKTSNSKDDTASLVSGSNLNVAKGKKENKSLKTVTVSSSEKKDISKNLRTTRSKNSELNTEKSSRQSKEKANKIFDASLKDFIDEVRGFFDKYGHVDQLSRVSVERKLNQLQLRDGTSNPAKPRHIEVLLTILKDEKNESQTVYLDDTLNPDSTENKIEAIECLIDKLTKVVQVDEAKNVDGSEDEEIFDRITKKVEKISLAKKSVAKKLDEDKKSTGAVKKKSQVIIPADVDSLANEIEKISINKNNKSSKVPVYLETSCDLFSDDEVVEATIIEPRRSKRVAAKKK